MNGIASCPFRETGWIRKADRSEALLPSIDEQMGRFFAFSVVVRMGPPDQFTARSLLRVIAAGMIAVRRPCRAGMVLIPRRQLHYRNKFRKQ
jgi:hypothetical protein